MLSNFSNVSRLQCRAKLYKNVIHWRNYKSSAKKAVSSEDEYGSLNQMLYRRARQMYENYPNVHYSSFLDCDVIRPQGLKGADAHFPIFPPLHEMEQMSRRLLKLKGEQKKLPAVNWLDDYEHYVGSVGEDGVVKATHGTPDPTLPASNISCNGCGTALHCKAETLPGYIPSEIFRGRTDRELRTIICKRCHFLKHYNVALDVEVAPETYIDTISSIKNQHALAIIIVDLLDFPCSLWPDIVDVLGKDRPVFVVGNKLDLLPRDSAGYRARVLECLTKQIVKHGGLSEFNVLYTGLISAKTGFGIEELITQLQKLWGNEGDVYLIGCTNVGKSSLFNILLNSDYCRTEATNLVRPATTCPWPGTTLEMLKFPIMRPSAIRVFHRFRRLFSERRLRQVDERMRKDQSKTFDSVESATPTAKVGRTYFGLLDVNDPFAASATTTPVTTIGDLAHGYRAANWTFDTPGVLHPDQITNVLTSEELVIMQPTQMITPRAFRLKPNMSLFLAGLGRIDLLDIEAAKSLEWVKVFVFSSVRLPVLIADTEYAAEVYERYLGTRLLGVPRVSDDDPARLDRWPGLNCPAKDIVIEGEKRGPLSRPEACLNADIVLSSAGWIGVLLPKECSASFRAWTPFSRGIYVRDPPLIPLAKRLVGKRKWFSLAHATESPFNYEK